MIFSVEIFLYVSGESLWYREGKELEFLDSISGSVLEPLHDLEEVTQALSSISLDSLAILSP